MSFNAFNPCNDVQEAIMSDDFHVACVVFIS